MKRVGILRGGKGKNYQSSIKRGGDLIVCIVENLKDKYKPVDILVDQDGMWHAGGLPTEPAQLVHKVDIVWNTADPEFSQTLSQFSIPVISAPHFFTMLSESREMLREHMKEIRVSMPKHIKNPKSAREVLEKFPAPWVLKSGSSIAVIKTFPELTKAFENNESEIIVEEFITGKPGATHSLMHFRGDPIYVFPVHGFTTEEKEKIESFTRDLHQHLGVTHYLKTDFTLHPRLGLYVNEISFSPDLRMGSHLHEALERIGAKLHHVVDHILEHP